MQDQNAQFMQLLQRLAAASQQGNADGRFVQGPGGGLDDLVPTTIEGREAAALSDGEIVIPADVVSMLGDGSSNAGSQRLYELIRMIRQEKQGTSEQAGPLEYASLYERIMG